jgi:hypothetical protein
MEPKLPSFVGLHDVMHRGRIKYVVMTQYLTSRTEIYRKPHVKIFICALTQFRAPSAFFGRREYGNKNIKQKV